VKDANTNNLMTGLAKILVALLMTVSVSAVAFAQSVVVLTVIYLVAASPTGLSLINLRTTVDGEPETFHQRGRRF
jgi:hypothetical protein